MEAPRVVKTLDREKAYRAVINVWLKSSPENIAVTKAIIKQNKYRRASAQNTFGSMKGFEKDLRIGLSLPHGLYYSLVQYERMHDREFMQDKKDLWWFAKKFPQFTICERI